MKISIEMPDDHRIRDNDDRAALVAPLAKVFSDHCSNDSLRQAICDMAVDLCHLWDRVPVDGDDFYAVSAYTMLEMAYHHYGDERHEEDFR